MTDGATATQPAHHQLDHPVRFDWGPTGAAAIARDAGVAVVVDVLSFTTTLCVAVERGMTVHPYPWRDDGAAAYAQQHDAVLAVGRLEARESGGGVSLSPAHLAAVDGVDRIVLPSPNGSSIAFTLRESGAAVVGGALRNATAVGEWVAARAGSGVAVVAAGERWPDGSLRPAVEDLWGAGAVLSVIADAVGASALSPEARAAVAAFRAVRDDLPATLADCTSGRELVTAGFADDVTIAARLDAADVVPVLGGEAFTAAR